MCGGDAGDGGQARVCEVQTGILVVVLKRSKPRAQSSSRPTNWRLSQAGTSSERNQRRGRTSPAAGHDVTAHRQWPQTRALVCRRAAQIKRARVRRRAAAAGQRASSAACGTRARLALEGGRPLRPQRTRQQRRCLLFTGAAPAVFAGTVCPASQAVASQSRPSRRLARSPAPTLAAPLRPVSVDAAPRTPDGCANANEVISTAMSGRVQCSEG